jgi:hypothetical protein
MYKNDYAFSCIRALHLKSGDLFRFRQTAAAGEKSNANVIIIVEYLVKELQ